MESDSVTASHNGYEKLGVKHIREISFNREKEEFIIKDSLKGNVGFNAEIPFHLHPNAKIQEVYKGVFEVIVPGTRKVVVSTDPSLDCRIAEGEENALLGWYSEHFGEKVPCKVIYASKECWGTSSFETKVKVLS